MRPKVLRIRFLPVKKIAIDPLELRPGAEGAVPIHAHNTAKPGRRVAAAIRVGRQSRETRHPKHSAITDANARRARLLAPRTGSSNVWCSGRGCPAARTGRDTVVTDLPYFNRRTRIFELLL